MSLEFNPVTHTYAWAGQVVPSVTQILKPIVDFSDIEPAVLAAAAERGHRVHLATELDDRGTLDESSVADDIRPYLQAWRDFKRESGAVMLEIERRVFHPELRYAGTLDRVLSLNGREFVADIKSSSQVHRAVGAQTAGYWKAYGAAQCGRAFIHLTGDGKYRFRELTDGGDHLEFHACLLIHRRNQETQYV